MFYKFKNYLKFKQIKNLFAFWFTIVSAIPLIIFSIVIYNERYDSLKEIEFEKLVAIRNLKVELLNQWFNELEGHLNILSSENNINNLIKVKSNKELIAVRKFLIKYKKNYSSFLEIFILNSQNGKVIVSTNKKNEGIIYSNESFFYIPLKKHKIYFSDINYYRNNTKPQMFLSIPIKSLKYPKKISGVLVAEIDLTKTLYRQLLNRTSMGKTGETLIVNKNSMALNELRWYKNAPLRLKITASPAVKASQGEQDIIETTDYRDEPILAAYTHIKKTGWGFIAKQDLAEIYKPIYNMLQQTILFLITALILVYFIALYVSQNISKPITLLRNISKKISQGNLLLSMPITRNDELGDLAKTFNDMSKNLLVRREINILNIEFANKMVKLENLNNFAKDMVNWFVKKTKSTSAGYYLVDKPEKKIKLIYFYRSKEIFKKNISSFINNKISNLELINEVILINQKEIINIFIDTKKNKKLREIIIIPLFIKNDIEAMFLLGKSKNYTYEDLEVLNFNYAALNTVYENLNTNLKVNILARELNNKNKELKKIINKKDNTEKELITYKKDLEMLVIKRTNELQKQISERHQLEKELINISENERKNIGQTLHDSLGQKLTAITFMGKALHEIMKKKSYPEIKNIEQIIKIAQDSVEQTRKLSKGLNIFELGSEGLISAIDELVYDTEKLFNIKCGFKIKNDLNITENSVALNLYYIIKESITNAIKHGNPDKIIINIYKEKNNTMIEITDNGKGILASDLSNKGMGLKIMEYRAKIIGAQFNIKKLRQGTKVKIILNNYNESSYKENK